jgi:hypothetical protein
MRIGILVDGQSEYQSLHHVIGRIDTQLEIIKRPLVCDLQPLSTPAQIAYVAAKASPILMSRGATAIVLLIDRERRSECVPLLSGEIEREFSKRLSHTCAGIVGRVVVKDRAFENWLVADPTAAASLPGMFENAGRITRAVVPDKADHVNALELLTSCSKERHFDKVEGAISICAKMAPERAARNSRSFRRFLRVLGNPRYSAQSKNPCSRATP